MGELAQLLRSGEWTQAKLARLAGVSKGTVGRLSRRERRASAMLALRIERATGGAVPAESLPMSDAERSLLDLIRASAA